MSYRVIVPCIPRKVGRRIIDAVSYPESQMSYTRDMAIRVLRKFGPDAWAESKTERFTLEMVEQGIV